MAAGEALSKYVMIVVYVPVEYTEAVRVAMCEAGAGTVGDGHYDRVVFITRRGPSLRNASHCHLPNLNR
jgi:hypothetical protein